MTEVFFRIRDSGPSTDRASIDAFDRLYSELTLILRRDGSVYRRYIPPRMPQSGSGPGNVEILVAIISSGLVGSALTALYQAFHSYLIKDKDRELTLERDGKRITIRGHNLPEEKELVRELFSDVLREGPSKLDDDH